MGPSHGGSHSIAKNPKTHRHEASPSTKNNFEIMSNIIDTNEEITPFIPNDVPLIQEPFSVQEDFGSPSNWTTIPSIQHEEKRINFADLEKEKSPLFGQWMDEVEIYRYAEVAFSDEKYLSESERIRYDEPKDRYLEENLPKISGRKEALLVCEEQANK
jgi:hypothetical protein